MKTTTFITTALLLLSSYGLFGQYQIGHTTINFQDPDRGNRTIETEIYYPANTAGTDETPVAGQFPVLVFGHGFVMAWSAYQNIWEELVPQGYIMAFPRTEGSMLSTNHQEFGWDLQFLVGAMQSEGNNSSSIIYGAVAPETALMGHSMGGGAAFLAADSLSVNGNQYLKTLVGLAPAESTTNGVSSIHSAGSIATPTLIFSGSQDGVTPPVDHHIPMYDSLLAACKTFINIVGGGHCYFANSNFNCDFGETTSSTGISISRAEQHDVTFDFLNLWLDYTLKGNCSAITVFNDSLSVSSRVTYNQNCTINTIDNGVTQNGNTLTADQAGATYQWVDCDNGFNAITGATNQAYTSAAGGNFAVQVTDNGCTVQSSCYSIVPAGIVENQMQLEIYPNPTSGQIQVNSSFEGTLEIIDLNGKLIGQYPINKGNNSITLEASPGVYLRRVRSPNQSNTFGKLVVK